MKGTYFLLTLLSGPKISANYYIFPCFQFKLLAQEEACPYIAKLHPCQEILAYKLERISFVGELTSFNTNSTINGQLFAKGEKKFSLRRLRFFSISLLNGVLHLGLYSAVQSKRKVAGVSGAWK